MKALYAGGLTVRMVDRTVEVMLYDEAAYDVIRDAVAGLGLGLVRMQRRRHHISEMFRPATGNGPTEDGAHVRA